MPTAMTDQQRVSLLFKKGLGVPSTNSNSEFYSEPTRPARAAVFQSQFFSEAIPATAPTDLVNATVDDVGATLTGSLAGKTSTVSTMVKRFVKVPLVEVVGSNGGAFESPVNTVDASKGRILNNSIPFSYDSAGSYLVRVYKADGSEIPFSAGSWIFDSDCGILTFYSVGDLTGVSAASPPSISVYTYCGAIGAQTAAQTIASISGQSIKFTAPEIFDGGTAGAVDSTLNALIVDDRNLQLLDSSTPAMSMSFGGNYDGSWRILVYGGSNTSLQFQTRVSGTWVTKSALFQQ